MDNYFVTELNNNQHNWKEHFHEENGQYYNRCTQCNVTYVGRKRSWYCRVCYYNNECLYYMTGKF